MKVEISKDILEILEKRVRETDEFSSIEDYVNYILKQVVEKLEGEAPEALSEDKEKEVEEQLKNLGYLD